MNSQVLSYQSPFWQCNLQGSFMKGIQVNGNEDVILLSTGQYQILLCLFRHRPQVGGLHRPLFPLRFKSHFDKSTVLWLPSQSWNLEELPAASILKYSDGQRRSQSIFLGMVGLGPFLPPFPWEWRGKNKAFHIQAFLSLFM